MTFVYLEICSIQITAKLNKIFSKISINVLTCVKGKFTTQNEDRVTLQISHLKDVL